MHFAISISPESAVCYGKDDRSAKPHCHAWIEQGKDNYYKYIASFLNYLETIRLS